jgi:hypothetical protein
MLKVRERDVNEIGIGAGRLEHVSISGNLRAINLPDASTITNERED